MRRRLSAPAAAQAPAPAPALLREQIAIEPVGPTTVSNALEKLNDAIAGFNGHGYGPVDFFLHQQDPASAIQAQLYGVGDTKASLLEFSNNTFSLNSQLEAQIKALSDSNEAAISAIGNDVAAINSLQTAYSAKPLLSTYQGRYAAGLPGLPRN
jgi:hypothetical protein